MEVKSYELEPAEVPVEDNSQTTHVQTYYFGRKKIDYKMLLSQLKYPPRRKYYLSVPIIICFWLSSYVVLEGAFAAKYGLKLEDVLIIDASLIVRFIFAILSFILAFLFLVVLVSEPTIELKIDESGIRNLNNLNIKSNDVKSFTLTLLNDNSSKKLYLLKIVTVTKIYKLYLYMGKQEKESIMSILGIEKYSVI